MPFLATGDDPARLQRVAEAAYLDASTWARQLLMRAVAEPGALAVPPWAQQVVWR